MLYAAPRPKTYADRQWLAGWCEVCAEINSKPYAAMHRGQAEMFVWIYRCRAWAGVLSARQKGRADAIMAAFGI